MDEEIAAMLAPLHGGSFIVMHDAYHYFEAHYDIEAAGAISAGDLAAGPARLDEVRGLISAGGALCIFAEPQVSPKLMQSIAEGADVKTGVLDPLGASLEPGPALWPVLMRNLAAELARCLSR